MSLISWQRVPETIEMERNGNITCLCEKLILTVSI